MQLFRYHGEGMIARRFEKHIASSAHGAVQYLLYGNKPPLPENYRAGEVWTLNCGTQSPKLAATEMEVVNKLNSRARTDNFYHYVISPGESALPDSKAMHEIERIFAKTLGFDNLLTLCVTHEKRTPHPHLHCFVLLIDPETGKKARTSWDFEKLARASMEVEQRYGLRIDNHQKVHSKGERLARDIEKHSGLESFGQYIDRVCGPALLSASSWEAVHEILREKSLNLRRHANGLAFDDGTESIRASAVRREFSLRTLEKRLGAFVPSSEKLPEERKQWRESRRPSGFGMDVSKLYAAYKVHKAAREEGIKELRAINRERDRLLMVTNARRHMFIERTRNRKSDQYRLWKAQFYEGAKQIRAEANSQRQKWYEGHKTGGFLDWLVEEAQNGNIKALHALRSRGGEPEVLNSQDKIQGVRLKPLLAFSALMEISFVTKYGAVVYKAGDGYITDDGNKIHVTRKVAESGLADALKLAREQFGKVLDIEGGAAFKERIINVAVNHKIDIRFNDARMEKTRAARVKTQERVLSK